MLCLFEGTDAFLQEIQMPSFNKYRRLKPQANRLQLWNLPTRLE